MATTTSVPLKLEPCTDADFPRFFEIVSLGFGIEHEYFNMVFPQHTTPVGRANGARRFLEIKHADPCAHFLKVTDTATGEMIGAAKWNVYEDTIPPEDGLGTNEFWETEHEAKYADAMYMIYLESRRGRIRDSKGNVICLDILAVDPKHHYRGAGRMLVDWGTKVADEKDFEAVVEASVYGRHLYEVCGFQKVSFVTINPPKEFDGIAKMKQRFFWMVRPKKSAAGKVQGK